MHAHHARQAHHRVQSHSILSVPFYDARQQQYTKILCINTMPSGALADRVKTVRPPRLSGLGSSSTSTSKCIHALIRDCGAYMTPDELPELFAFLVSNGYTVDTGLTKLAAKHQPGGPNANANANANSLVCIISHTTGN
jgi:hypothetical protein